MKKWQCTICGYVHTGDEPPEICPVCGADKSLFIELVEDKKESQTISQAEIGEPTKNASVSGDPKTSKTPSAPLFSYDGITDLMIKHHAHPISVHFPNGIIPMSVAFIFLAVIFQFTGLSQASFYSMIFVMLTLPVVLFTGYNEWKKKYRGALTRIFMIKIVSAAVVSACTLISVVWFIASPQVLQTPSSARTFFLLIHLILLAATGIAGHLGGKLVFKD
jgi:uncharacterized membrane protein/RNA polymerase subunit RPABC4/transcription elongation factor Spt4